MGSRNRSFWSDLPAELLQIIADRLRNNADVFRVRSVCKSWRSSVLPIQEPLSFPLKIPYFGPQDHSQTFLVLSHSTIYRVSLASGSKAFFKLRETKSPGQGPRLVLVDPLGPHELRTPPTTQPRATDPSNLQFSELTKIYTLQFSDGSFCNYRVATCVNLDCPSSIMIVASGVLWELKLQCGATWRVTDDKASQLFYEDVVLYHGKFCAVDYIGRAVEVDPSSSSVGLIARPLSQSGRKKSLVVSGGDLLLVDAYRSGGQADSMTTFRVFKLNADEKRWDEVQSLNNQILFLADECSYSLSASGYGNGNCIVFRDPLFGLDNDGKLSSMALTRKNRIFALPPST